MLKPLRLLSYLTEVPCEFGKIVPTFQIRKFKLSEIITSPHSLVQ